MSSAALTLGCSLFLFHLGWGVEVACLFRVARRSSYFFQADTFRSEPFLGESHRIHPTCSRFHRKVRFSNSISMSAKLKDG
jgi:hypothetical protein